jgi:hypothetical protein
MDGGDIHTCVQRVLNDLKSTRLLAHPSFPLSHHKLSLFRSLPVCHRWSLLTGEGGMWRERSHIIRPRESLALYTSFNVLWYSLWAGLRVVVPGVVPVTYMPPPPPHPSDIHTHVTCTIAHITWLSLFTQCHA